MIAGNIKIEDISNFTNKDYFIDLSGALENEKGKKIFDEIFQTQKKRIYDALLDSKSDEVLNFERVLNKIING